MAINPNAYSKIRTFCLFGTEGQIVPLSYRRETEIRNK